MMALSKWCVVSKQPIGLFARNFDRRGIRSISVLSRWPFGNRWPKASRGGGRGRCRRGAGGRSAVVNFAHEKSCMCCRTTDYADRRAASEGAATTLPWSRSSLSYNATTWIGNGGPPGRSCGWRSSPGSSGPCTEGAGSVPSEGSRRSSSTCSTQPSQRRPDIHTPRESTELGAVPGVSEVGCPSHLWGSRPGRWAHACTSRIGLDSNSRDEHCQIADSDYGRRGARVVYQVWTFSG